MGISRRKLLSAAGATALTAGLPLRHAFAADPIKLGAIQDDSGVLDIYGKPMVMATAMAVDEINKSGGLLGRQIELKQYDSQSNIALYTRDAQELVRNKFDVAHAGITSASREAVRQTFRRGNLCISTTCSMKAASATATASAPARRRPRRSSRSSTTR